MRIINGQWLSIALDLREGWRAEVLPNRIAIAAMFDNVCSFMAAIILLQRFYKLERKTPKAC